MRILIIEDEILLAGHMARALSRCGHSLDSHSDCGRGLRRALEQRHDLVVLDLVSPSLGGVSVLQQLRHARSAPRMLLLTESNERRAMLEGSEPGTEDYLTKPFAIGELVERVEALGRRAPNSPAGCRFTLADLHLDLRQGRASRAGRDLELTRNEFRLLSIFMGEPGRIFSRAELSERLWRREHRYDSRSVEMLVSRLRKKVDTGFTPDLVHTFYSVGYSLAGR